MGEEAEPGSLGGRGILQVSRMSAGRQQQLDVGEIGTHAHCLLISHLFHSSCFQAGLGLIAILDKRSQLLGVNDPMNSEHWWSHAIQSRTYRECLPIQVVLVS